MANTILLDTDTAEESFAPLFDAERRLSEAKRELKKVSQSVALAAQTLTQDALDRLHRIADVIPDVDLLLATGFQNHIARAIASLAEARDAARSVAQ